jgi:hypothetical protein
MRDKYYDPEGWKKCTLRSVLGLGEDLWLICGTCQKSRGFDTAEWAAKHGVDLDLPLKTLEKAIRCQRCGARGKDRGVSAYARPYTNLQPQPKHRNENDPICPRCGSDDVQSRRMLVSEFPGVTIWTIDKIPRFVAGKVMIRCGCYACNNFWTQSKVLSSARLEFQNTPAILSGAVRRRKVDAYG